MKSKHLVAFAVVSSLTATTMFVAAPVVSKPVATSEVQSAAVQNPDSVYFSAASLTPEAAELLAANGVQPKQPTPRKANPNKTPGKSGEQDTLSLNPTQKNLALLVKFPQENGHSAVPGSPDERVPAKYFNDLLYGTEYNPYDLPQFAQHKTAPNGIAAPTDRTLHNYFKEISYGKLNVTTDDSPETVGWITAPHPYSYYFGNTGKLPTSETEYNANGFGDYPYNVQGLLEDVVKIADEKIDFSKYADASGVVPGIFIIHEGTGGEWSADPQQFWSHKWEANEPIVVDGVQVSQYSMEPELGGNLTGYTGVGYDPAYKTGPFAPQVGVYAHEFGHILGLPDLYDYGYDSQGVGAWSVMAGGSWARYPNYVQYNGNTPVQLDAWNRYFAGFADVKEVSLDSVTHATLPAASESGTIYKVTVPQTSGSEYFLFENRQLSGYDLGLGRYGGVSTGKFNDKMHGMVVYHVDDNVLQRNFWRPNEAQDANPDRRAKNPLDVYTGTGEWHQAVAVVQADGQFQLEQYLSSGDAGDVYPGTTGKTSLTFSNSFYSGSYYRPQNFFEVHNITEKDGVVKAQFVPVKGNK